jgi:hypothetical protein
LKIDDYEIESSSPGTNYRLRKFYKGRQTLIFFIGENEQIKSVEQFNRECSQLFGFELIEAEERGNDNC